MQINTVAELLKFGASRQHNRPTLCSGRSKSWCGIENIAKLLFDKKQFPILQNRVYETIQDAVDCPKDDITIIEDRKTGLVYNTAFNPDLIVYDGNYNNEQALSPLFKKHLEQLQIW